MGRLGVLCKDGTTFWAFCSVEKNLRLAMRAHLGLKLRAALGTRNGSGRKLTLAFGADHD